LTDDVSSGKKFVLYLQIATAVVQDRW